MEPPVPSPEDNVSDYERIIRTLKTEHDVFPVSASLDILRELPRAGSQRELEDHGVL